MMPEKKIRLITEAGTCKERKKETNNQQQQKPSGHFLKVCKIAQSLHLGWNLSTGRKDPSLSKSCKTLNKNKEFQPKERLPSLVKRDANAFFNNLLTCCPPFPQLFLLSVIQPTTGTDSVITQTQHVFTENYKATH